ncbi:MAG: DUF2059 domain-containing protein [Acidobacteriota bacterium]
MHCHGTRILRAALLLLLLFAASHPALPTPAVATEGETATTSPEVAAQVDRLIAVSGLAAELADDLTQTRSLLVARCAASDRCTVYSDAVTSTLAAGTRELKLGPIARPPLAEMVSLLSEDDVEQIFAFYDSPLGRRIVEQEATARTAEHRQQVANTTEEIYWRLTDDRIAQIETFDSSTDFGALRRLQAGFAERVIGWLDRRAEEQDRTGTPSGDGAPIDRHRLHVHLGLMFEPLTDDELDTYLDFVTGDVGETWFATRREIRANSVRADLKVVLTRLIDRLAD